MTIEHGASVSEVPTGAKPPVSVSAGLPVYFGTAKINAGDPTSVNKPVLCNTLADYVAAMGPLGTDFGNWTLDEAADAHFLRYKVGPIVVVNVLDPARVGHFAVVAGEAHVLDVNGNATLSHAGALAAGVVVHNGGVMVLNTDYSISFDSVTGALVISRIAGGAILAGAAITVDYHYLTPAGVTGSDIVGGYVGGKYTGIQVAEQVYPALRLVPGLLLAPKFSTEPSVAAALVAEAHLVNGAFRAIALTDLSPESYDIGNPAAAPAWASTFGFNALDQIACWPLFSSGGLTYHLSTLVACLIGTTDAAHDGIPYASPSNHALVGDGATCFDGGAQVLLTRPQANQLNSSGIVTAINGFFGWKLWGNRMAVLGGGNTDVKDVMIPLRRMFNWIEATIILTSDQMIDEPGNRRLIDSVLDTINSFLNGLTAQGALVFGLLEFRSTENPVTDLSNGKIRWHLTATPPSPAEAIDYVVEYDPSKLAALFS